MATYAELMDAARRADAAGDAEATKRFLELAKAAKGSTPQTNLAEQVGTGTSEGIANIAGMPVDLATKGINAATGAFGLPPIENPVAGSGFFKAALDPFMADAEPQSAGQRIGRRIGQDVGAGAVAGPVAGISSLGGMGLNAAADAASGLAGGITSEATDNPIVNVITSLLAGSSVPAISKAMRPNGAPSVRELKNRAGRLYDQVADSDFRLSADEAQELQGNVSARMYDERMNPSLDKRAVAGVDEIYGLGSRSPEGTPSLQELEEARRYVSRKVVPSTEPGEQGLGLAMKDEIDKYIDAIAARPTAPEDVLALKEARAVTRRYKGAEQIDKVSEIGGLRAAVTGSGGNGINAIRSRLADILASPKLRAGYSKAELAEMEKIARGTRVTNTARRLGVIAPQRGGLGLAGALVATGGAGALDNIWVMTPTVVSTIAQTIGEEITKKQARDLSAMVRAGKPIKKALTDGEKAVLAALLASQGQQQLLGQPAQ